MCQRYLALPVRWIVAVSALLFVVLVFGSLRYSGRIKNKVDAWSITPRDVLAAAQTLVAANPSVAKPTSFSSLAQTTLERWDGRRWRVSGYFESAGVRTLYFAVVQYNGTGWQLEDLQLQNVPSAPKP